MIACAIVVLFVLAGDIVHSTFVCTPKDFTPQTTQSIELRCDPLLEKALTVLAVHIRKRTDFTEIEQIQPQGIKEINGAQQTTANQSAEKQTKSSEETELSKLRELFINTRSKRDAGKNFDHATLTPGNNKDLQPNDDRFHVDGDINTPPYMLLTMKNPDVNDIGTYECQATYLDARGSVHTTSEVVHIQTEVEITVSDMEKRVQKIESDVNTFRETTKQVFQLELQTKSQDALISEQVEANVKQIKQLFDIIYDIANQVTSLNDKVKVLEEKAERQGTAPNNAAVIDNSEAEKENQKRKDQLDAVEYKLQHMETTQIQALASHLKEMRSDLVNTINEVRALELTVNDEVKKSLHEIEQLDYKGTVDSMNKLETETIPILTLNISDCQRSIAELKGQRSVKGGGDTAVAVVPKTESVQETTPAETPTETPTESPTTTPQMTTVVFKGPACYVCGRNETEEPCPLEMVKNAVQCESRQRNCITDIYQDGTSRYVYKRCATENDCMVGKSKSSPDCNTENFVHSKAIVCIFCCTSQLCNSGLRPKQDLY